MFGYIIYTTLFMAHMTGLFHSLVKSPVIIWKHGGMDLIYNTSPYVSFPRAWLKHGRNISLEPVKNL